MQDKETFTGDLPAQYKATARNLDSLCLSNTQIELLRESGNDHEIVTRKTRHMRDSHKAHQRRQHLLEQLRVAKEKLQHGDPETMLDKAEILRSMRNDVRRVKHVLEHYYDKQKMCLDSGLVHCTRSRHSHWVSYAGGMETDITDFITAGREIDPREEVWR